MIGRAWRRFNNDLDRFAVPIAICFFVVAVWASSYGGRINIHRSQVAACVRGNLDRVADIERDGDNADFLANAEVRALRNGDADIAANYHELRQHAIERVRRGLRRIVVCSKVYKDPSVIELPPGDDVKPAADPAVKPQPRLSRQVRASLS